MGSARPLAIAALAVAIALGWLASKLYGRGARLADDPPALLAPLLFSTTVAALGFARAATPDMLFSASSLALAMVSAAGNFSPRWAFTNAHIRCHLRKITRSFIT